MSAIPETSLEYLTTFLGRLSPATEAHKVEFPFGNEMAIIQSRATPEFGALVYVGYMDKKSDCGYYEHNHVNFQTRSHYRDTWEVVCLQCTTPYLNNGKLTLPKNPEDRDNAIGELETRFREELVDTSKRHGIRVLALRNPKWLLGNDELSGPPFDKCSVNIIDSKDYVEAIRLFYGCHVQHPFE